MQVLFFSKIKFECKISKALSLRLTPIQTAFVRHSLGTLTSKGMENLI